MKKEIVCIILAALLLPATAMGQKRKAAKKKKEKEEVVVEDPKLLKMLPATAQVVIVDSTVIDADALLDAIHVNPEEGRVESYSQFFQKMGDGYVYINELGNKCIYSLTDDNGETMLYQSDMEGGVWTEGEKLLGLDDGGRLSDLSYPYLMPDGITLYFSARGSECLGGYDIFRSRFDAETGRFLKPENLGFPFNSYEDDYMFVIDEQNQLAYFASNRRQPLQKTCVYCFIPFETRRVVNAARYTDEQIRSLARIDRIADTWGNGRAQKQALSKLQAVASTRTKKTTKNERFSFVINDQKTYTRLTDFRRAENRSRMKELLDLQMQKQFIDTSLEKAYNYYAKARPDEQAQLKSEILRNEQLQEQLDKEILQMEKTIRNTENQ